MAVNLRTHGTHPSVASSLSVIPHMFVPPHAHAHAHVRSCFCFVFLVLESQVLENVLQNETGKTCLFCSASTQQFSTNAPRGRQVHRRCFPLLPPVESVTEAVVVCVAVFVLRTAAASAAANCGCHLARLPENDFETHCGLDMADKSKQDKWHARKATRKPLDKALVPILLFAADFVSRRRCDCSGTHRVCRQALVGLLGAHKPDTRFKINCLFFRPQAVAAALCPDNVPGMRFLQPNWADLLHYLRLLRKEQGSLGGADAFVEAAVDGPAEAASDGPAACDDGGFAKGGIAARDDHGTAAELLPMCGDDVEWEDFPFLFFAGSDASDDTQQLWLPPDVDLLSPAQCAGSPLCNEQGLRSSTAKRARPDEMPGRDGDDDVAALHTLCTSAVEQEVCAHGRCAG